MTLSFSKSKWPRGVASPAVYVVGSVVVLAFLIGLLVWEPPRAKEKSLVIHCAAAIEPVVTKLAKRYESEYGVYVEIRPGNTGSLLSTIKSTQEGDLFIPAEDTYLVDGLREGWIAEQVILAKMNLVVGVKPGNPKAIKLFADLDKVVVGVCNTKAAAGRMTETVLQQQNLWSQLHPKVASMTVTELALAVATEHLDAGFMWDATARQHGLEPIALPELAKGQVNVAAGVLTYSKQPTAALRFARYLAAPDRGKPEFTKQHFQESYGDDWEWEPKIILFSGGVNRLAIQTTLTEFEAREGCRINVAYEGCGTLLGMIREAGQRPDAYFACDVSFVTPDDISSLFDPPQVLSSTDIVLLVHRGNPQKIQGLSDLARPGIKLGVAHETLSALGSLTKRLLVNQKLYEQVKPNVRSGDDPKADLLVNKMLAAGTDALDVIVVYRANASQVREKLDVINLEYPEAKAVQPWVMLKDSKHRQLVDRLRATLQSAESQNRFKNVGFQWRAGAAQP